jgi:hypothetical protein
MKFELRQDAPPPLTYAPAPFPTEAAGGGVVTRVAAHRVIVCARCSWFRRALASGMQEAQQRRIILHDTSPAVFDIFLQFVYAGLQDLPPLECRLPSIGQLADLLLLADRYEAGLEKTRVKQKKPAQWVFFVFLFFFGFWVFLYICLEERVFRVSSVSRILFRCIQTLNYNHSH